MIAAINTQSGHCLRPTLSSPLRILAVDERHQFEFVATDFHRAVVERRATQTQQLALAGERERIGLFDHGQPLPPCYSPDLRSKKSRSTIPRPSCS